MDSDDEHDRRPRGRDKFRRERSDYNERSGRRGDDRSSRRDDWSDRRRPVWDSRRKDYRDFDRDRRDSGGRHHEISPPMKRVRRDWDNVGYQADYPGYNPMANQWVSPMEMQQNVHQRQFDSPQHPVDMKSGPSMMSFKQFLNSMEDNIDDMESVKKYKDYKVEFRRTQIADFFTTHKDEEWFRNKYHPDDSLSYQNKLNAAIRKRAAVFIDLLQSGWLEKFSLTADQGEDFTKLLDAAVIKFEGGTELDLQVLSKPVEPEERNKSSNDQGKQTAGDGQNDSKNTSQEGAPVSPSSVPLPETPAPPSATVKSASFKPEVIKPLEMSDPSPEQLKLRQEAEKYHQQQLQQQQQREQQLQQHREKESQAMTQPIEQPLKEKGQKRKRKRRHREPYYYDENVESESESESDIDSEPAPPGEESARRDAQERAAEERLLPPGVETEPISTSEVTSDQDGSTDKDIQPPGTENNGREILMPTSVETSEVTGKDSEAGEEKESLRESLIDKVKQVSDEVVKTNIPTEETPAVVTEQMETNNKDNDEAMEVASEVKEGVSEDKDDAMEVKEGAMEVKEGELKESGSDEKVELPATESKLEEKQEQEAVTSKEEPESNENKMDTSSNVDEKMKEKLPVEIKNDVPKPEAVEEVKTPQPLHQTVSLFVRNVPPKISHNDIASVCSRFPGFMRVVLSDPSPDRKFSRRGWITFKPNVNIKDICWTINNMKIKEIELNPIVNRELARRVRTVSGASVLKEIVATDISMARKLIEELDEKYRVWKMEEEEEVLKKSAEESLKKTEAKVEVMNDEEESEVQDDSSVAPVPSEEPKSVVEKQKEPTKTEIVEKLPKSNPILALLPASVPDKTQEKKAEIQVATGDEQGQVGEEGQVPDEGELSPEGQTSVHPTPVVDEELVKILDRLLLYLRIVHSLDYYSGTEYLYEDDMPNRCGIVHIRNTLPEKINYDEVSDWHKNLHLKLDQHLKNKESLPEEDASQLGKKDQDQEMDKFVQANTQELAKDKWLCPLSGKKFRGPEFVKKHIFNKHADKVEGVKTEVSFFNNFVYDPKRPSEPDMRPTMPGVPGNQGFQGGASHPMGMQGGNMGWGRGGMMQPGGRGGFGATNISPNYRSGPEHYRGQSFQNKPRRGSLRRDPRQIVQYKDLDAPGDEIDFF